jgi:hypothetical protein
MKTIFSQAALDTAFLAAVKSGAHHAAAVLLDKGADVHAEQDEALRFGSAQGKTGFVRTLLRKGASVEAKDCEALRAARQNGHERIVDILEQAAHAALMRAAQTNEVNTLYRLLSYHP